MQLFKRKPGSDVRFGLAIKLGLLLAAFGVLAAGLTGYYSYTTTREILVKGSGQDLLLSTQMLGRRFAGAVNDVANDARYMAKVPRTHGIFAAANDAAGQEARRMLAEQFRTMLTVHPEYFQVRLISAAHNGIELVRVDRDGDQLVSVASAELQEKAHYPYVFSTLKLGEGQIHFSKIFINREEGAHSALNQPTLQVATPVVAPDGRNLGVIVINVDLNQLFGFLKTDLSSDFQVYLANRQGDFLIHPDSSKTFGFDYGRRFLMQDEFTAVAGIVEGTAEQATLRLRSAEDQQEVIGGFVRIPFGDDAERRYVILGLTVPLEKVLEGTDALAVNIWSIVISFSLLAVLLSILVSHAFVRPLRQLVRAVQRFSATRELIPLPGEREDELGLLARSFGDMQQHILAHLDEVRQRKDDMEHLARHDALTGAPNRVMFFDLLRFAISNARRHASQLAVLFIDLDHFKQVNDSYGHGAGDAVLVEVARRLRATVRESDSVARLSGDEFVVLIQSFEDVQQLKLIAQKLIAAMHAPIEYDGQLLTVGLSLGISIFPGDGDNAEDLLHNADVAMYRSKRDGRNTYTFHV